MKINDLLANLIDMLAKLISLVIWCSVMVQQLGEDEAAKEPLQMALFTLLKLATGGVYDHLGGGFARYSVDEYYHVPHFEKMMYDNAQLAATYVAAYRMTGDERYALIARGVLDYVLRDMTSPDGGVYSAEDADSVDVQDNVSKEGAFYLWTAEELDSVLGDQAAGFRIRYMVQPGQCFAKLLALRLLSTKSDRTSSDFLLMSVAARHTEFQVFWNRFVLSCGSERMELALKTVIPAVVRITARCECLGVQ